ncbi:hypothetical protein [Aliiroseovarius sp.]|uniref:hypothetical protein n=1 Tax=Aliiroseovarius sp. TaxID=1872442 RepID=UPI002638F4CB|nr:hypothetical protein [Aliiroseovarius sp.]
MRCLYPFVILPLVLAACSERQTCESRTRSHLHDINLQIREAQDNLSRGYSLVKRDQGFVFGTRICSRRGDVRFCAGSSLPQYHRVRIDQAAEQAKLNALEIRKAALEREVAQCAEAYPEG